MLLIFHALATLQFVSPEGMRLCDCKYKFAQRFRGMWPPLFACVWHTLLKLQQCNVNLKLQDNVLQ